MRYEQRIVTTKIGGVEYEKEYTAVFPESISETLELFSEEDALLVIVARLEVTQDTNTRNKLITEHSEKKPKKTTKRINYSKLIHQQTKKVAADNEHLQEVLEKNRKKYGGAE